MTRRAADDADFIFGRIAELRKEAKDRLNVGCDCPDDVREDGTTIKAHRTGCPHYVAPTAWISMLTHCPASPTTEHHPEDNWKRLKAAIDAHEAAIMRFRHLRPADLCPRHSFSTMNRPSVGRWCLECAWEQLA